MSSQDTIPSELCQIVGLTSEVGKKRNGAAARVMSQKTIQTGKDLRHPVSVDGFPGPMSIKTSNIQMYQEQTKFSVGVGRGTINDTNFKAALVLNSQIAEQSMINGAAARSRGNLEAMDKFVKYQLQKVQAPVLILLTDLNIARAMNRAVLGDETVQLAAPLNSKFQTIKNKLQKNKKQILVKYDPHRVHEDRFEAKSDRLGPQRFQSVKGGSYQIYPCALKQYMDAHEVRYVDVSEKRSSFVINHEIYLDYGVEEATMYARHVAAMGELDRLFPEVLAQVDPQAFWSAVLWLTQFIETLEELNLPVDLVDQWTSLKPGRETSKEHLKMCMSQLGFEPDHLKGPEENWGIKSSQDVHLRIATDYAIGAVDAVQHSLVISKNVTGGDVKLHTLDYYIGTELDNYIAGIHKFYESARVEGTIDPDRLIELFDKAMKSVGFGKQSRFRINDPHKVCDNCGKNSKKKLMTCSRCEGVSYCNAKCQREHWKQHRSHCSRVFVQFEKQMAKLNNGGKGPKIEAGMYKGGGSLPHGPSMISEVSGMGMVSIFWNPDGQSSITLLQNSMATAKSSGLAYGANAHEKEIQAMAGAAGQDFAKNTITFRDFTDLHPTQRFLVCCGPLPDLFVAQRCVGEAIRCCEGKIDELRVPNLGFTALEWAAKKGNMEIVEWLCTDPRTKGLVEVGCPVGWAGYTGRVEIMRYLVSLGADPNKTDAILWGEQLPLFVAATNGELEACKFYVDECNQDIKMKDRQGNNILKYIKDAPNWREQAGHTACHKWAKKLLDK